jgi:hypothetical protein
MVTILVIEIDQYNKLINSSFILALIIWMLSDCSNPKLTGNVITLFNEKHNKTNNNSDKPVKRMVFVIRTWTK